MTMKWNRKYIAVFSALFFVLAAFLLVKGWQIPKEESILQRGTEEAIVEPVVSGGFIQEDKPEQETADKDSAARKSGESREKKQQKKKDSEKKEKSGESVKTDKTDTKTKKSGASSGQTEKKSSGKKNTAGAKNSSSATAEPTAAPNTPGTDGGKDEAEKTETERQVSFQIDCVNILGKRDLWKEGIEEIIPSNGIFYQGTVTFTEGESVYDLLKRICRENKIALDSQYTPLYGTYYVRGIGNLYEFDCGEESGWKYAVNGILPGTGSSGYLVKSGDNIQFYYDYQY